ncbi:7913_t:CDS:2, partial [Cetraspora pellucida]
MLNKDNNSNSNKDNPEIHSSTGFTKRNTTIEKSTVQSALINFFGVLGLLSEQPKGNKKNEKMNFENNRMEAIPKYIPVNKGYCAFFQKFSNWQSMTNHLVSSFDPIIESFNADDINFLINNKDIHSGDKSSIERRNQYKADEFKFTENRIVIDSLGSVQNDELNNIIVCPDLKEEPVFSDEKPIVSTILLCVLLWYQSFK